MVGIKSLVKIKPEILEQEVTLKEIIDTIKSKDKLTKKEKNILEEITQKEPKPPTKEKNKVGILETNYKIIGIGEQFFNRKKP